MDYSGDVLRYTCMGDKVATIPAGIIKDSKLSTEDFLPSPEGESVWWASCNEAYLSV